MVGGVGEIGDPSVWFGSDAIDEPGPQRLQAGELGVELFGGAAKVEVGSGRKEMADVRPLLVIGAL